MTTILRLCSANLQISSWTKSILEQKTSKLSYHIQNISKCESNLGHLVYGTTYEYINNNNNNEFLTSVPKYPVPDYLIFFRAFIRQHATHTEKINNNANIVSNHLCCGFD